MSLKRLSSPGSQSHSSIYFSFSATPKPIKKYRFTNQKQNLSRNTSKPNLSSKVSRPVSRNPTPQKKLTPNPSKSKLTRKSHKLQKSSMPIFRIPFYCVPQDADTLNEIIEPRKTPITRNDFSFRSKIGAGGFGEVWKVEFLKNQRLYALKQISKIKVIVKKSVNSILNEKQILLNLYNPFIVNMKCSFQDKEKLYLVIDYLAGGDLRYRLFHQKSFSEEQSKFFVACIVLALEYLRNNNIIHRDLKPENLVFEGTGYLRLTDFGVSRFRKENNSDETSGTPGYMSPEVICKQNHSFEADYFALGVIAYELMLRKRPYNGNRKQIREQILSKQVKVRRDQIPTGWSQSVMDFINKLITRKKQNRLGVSNIQQIKKHPWMNSIDWNKLKNKQMKVPFKAKPIGESLQYLKEVDMTSSDNQNQLEYQEQRLLLRNREIQDLFSDYENPGSFKMYQGRCQEQKSTFCTRDD